MMNEQLTVLRLFEKNIKARFDSVVLYGVGRYSKAIIENYPDYITGVCAQNLGEMMFFCDRKIIRVSEVHKYAKVIVIVARPIFLKDIYDRIKMEIDNEVKILSLYGDNLSQPRTCSFLTILDILDASLKTEKDELLYRYIKNTYEETGYDLVKCVLGPYFLMFISWLYHKMFDRDTLIWFIARDGYLIHKMYNRYQKSFRLGILPRSEYVLGSRRAFSSISTFDEESIDRVVNYKNYSENDLDVFLSIIKGRFGIDVEPNDLSNHDCVCKLILERAKKERENYFLYLHKNNLIYNSIMLFDFVTSGSAYRYLKQLLPDEVDELNLLAFAYISSECQFEGSLDYCWYGEKNYYTDLCNLVRVYPPFEQILSPNSRMFEYMDSNMCPHFRDEDEKEGKEWEEIVYDLQCRIIGWMDNYIVNNSDALESEYSIDFADALLEPLKSEYDELIGKRIELTSYNVFDSVKERTFRL